MATLTPEDYKALADGYLKELEDAKEASGYAAYCATTETPGRLTFNGYLRRVKPQPPLTIPAILTPMKPVRSITLPSLGTDPIHDRNIAHDKAVKAAFQALSDHNQVNTSTPREAE